MHDLAFDPAILSIGTAVPPHKIDQQEAFEWTCASLDTIPAQRRLLQRLYTMSGIATRYSCVDDAATMLATSRFAPGRALADTPTTAERMAIYQRESVKLGTAAARNALAELPADATAQITHLIVVSCTGFFAPGLDLAIAQQLGLDARVQRTLIGFMGCAAAFNGLRLASQITSAQPTARVLLVCVELCTLHLQPGNERSTLTVASLFSDGAAACVVGAGVPSEGNELFVLNRMHTEVLPDTSDAMGWQIGDHGFVMRLSPDVPRQVGELASSALTTLLAGQLPPSFWAIHPGGRAIVDRLAEQLDLTPAQTAASYGVLRNYGNMSSPTILFVLRAVREELRAAERPAHGVAAAFGPGLVTEMAYLTYVPAAQPVPASLSMRNGVYVA